MKMIKLTNASSGFEGRILYLNSDWIVSVFEQAVEAGGSISTLIFGGPGSTIWSVEESTSKIIALIQE
jgi:predicted enzyme related to lactoylglutathione lyase